MDCRPRLCTLPRSSCAKSISDLTQINDQILGSMKRLHFFARINKKLLSHHEAYEGDEGFGKLFTFRFLNFVPLATFLVKFSFSFGFSARASTRVRFPERGE